MLSLFLPTWSTAVRYRTCYLIGAGHTVSIGEVAQPCPGAWDSSVPLLRFICVRYRVRAAADFIDLVTQAVPVNRSRPSQSFVALHTADSPYAVPYQRFAVLHARFVRGLCLGVQARGAYQTARPRHSITLV